MKIGGLVFCRKIIDRPRFFKKGLDKPIISCTFALVNFEYRSEFQTILSNCPWFVRIAYTQDSNKEDSVSSPSSERRWRAAFLLIVCQMLKMTLAFDYPLIWCIFASEIVKITFYRCQRSAKIAGGLLGKNAVRTKKVIVSM